MPEVRKTIHLRDLWDVEAADKIASEPLRLLRYRSNLLGRDLRVTNFGGGNTSSKLELSDPFSGKPARVLAVKGSGGDLGSIAEAGFALLYLDRIEHLKDLYRGETHEDEMVNYYPFAAFGENRVATSIDTPLHALLPFAHVDHLHPDWAIALAASANGKRKLQQFNEEYGRRIVWLPWQRPGFELALMIEKAVKENPGIDGILLGGHGLFTWGDTQRGCYLNSIHTIDQMGEFIEKHQAQKEGGGFGGLVHAPRSDRKNIAVEVLPALRGALSSHRRVIAHYTDCEEALTFAGSRWSKELSALGTSCPDHFLRTKVCPLFLEWNPAKQDVNELKAVLLSAVAEYREAYAKYYQTWAASESPKMRDSNPSVVIVPGVGLFGFGRNKKEARITTEFFLNAIHVMAGANAVEDEEMSHPLPQARHPEQSAQFTQFHNYVALPRSEAFRIEYWALEEAKLRRMPAEAEFSRKIALILGGAGGIGRETALLLARKGAHVVIADFDEVGAKKVTAEAAPLTTPEFLSCTEADLASAESLSEAIRHTILEFGGIDVLVNTAAIYPVPEAGGELSEAQWAKTFQVNVTGNSLLVRASEWVFREQRLRGAMVLTSSANAVVPKSGSEAYDTSKAALSHLIRELAIQLAPNVRVNGIAPATVVAGSSMFPRERVIQSLHKYELTFCESDSTEALRDKLAHFYAQRTLLRQPITPELCAAAVVWLAGEQSARTTGHVIPVDGGLTDAFLR
jgi:rhamnose utilization protein RhaD (predicted bifunctional aldolase and dehydrogenase)/NAD(P)-dependent dehydrogenase (short-subunit alcohol dehydrogenase family)